MTVSPRSSARSRDRVDVERRVTPHHRVVPPRQQDTPRRQQRERRHTQLQARVDEPMPSQDRVQPSGMQREPVERTPREVVVPRAVHRARHGPGVEPEVDDGELGPRIDPGSGLDERSDGEPTELSRLELQPGTVEDEPGDPVLVPGRPQAQGEATRRMPEEDESATGPPTRGVVRGTVPHDGEGGLDVLVVGTEIVHVPGRLARPEASSVLPQVERVEPCAESRPESREVPLEEVVRPAVDVQDVDPVGDVGSRNSPSCSSGGIR